MKYRVTHSTTYDYSAPVSLCHSEAHIEPRGARTQTCDQFNFCVEPRPTVESRRRDYFGNIVHAFSIQEPHRRLVLTASSLVEVAPNTSDQALFSRPWEFVRDSIRGDRSPSSLDAYQYVFDSPYVKTMPELAKYAMPSFLPGTPLLDACLDLTHRIHTDFTYDSKATSVATPIEEVLKFKRGVCQDFSHLQVGCLRSLGLPARYVSGYLLTNPAPGKERLIGADASHAWVSVYCLNQGWIDFDPTNDQIPSGKHITVAWGRDFGDVSPIRGVILGGGDHQVTVGVSVMPV